ncbi:HAMP domain-containing histidine kinase [Mesorhizobium sp. RP14(2022)]|uniref:histidine kinase n=1 Tax=Mesorhizobium liriopis TaxID=2953882 RepID=A0ABT1CAK5_9HYPH|nr:HAMP domain-containing histidine kinase [Mesorhizobium liriopis]
MPRSLAGRLLLAAGAAIAVALVVAGVLISSVLERFVVRQVDGRLDAQIALLDASLADGDASLEEARDRPPFDRREKWVWVVSRDNRITTSAFLGSQPDFSGRGREADPGEIRPFDLKEDDGRLIHWRVLRKNGSGSLIAAGAPYDPAIGRPLAEAMQPLVLALLALGTALLLAALIQVRLGLRPLRALQEELHAIRAGKRQSVSENQPSEVMPLATELNKLLSENAEGLARARRHAANLAHGLKTPLATLAAAPSATQDPQTSDLVERMDRLIRHHLTRARAAALGETSRARTEASARLGDLADVMRAVHAPKPVAVEIDLPAETVVACEAQDFDEIFGNLLDNAFKWARGTVRISASREQRKICIRIEDDGPGISAEAVEDVLKPGKRLDETVPGYGFGLPIATELAELYGGSVRLGASADLKGACAEVRLPSAQG